MAQSPFSFIKRNSINVCRENIVYRFPAGRLRRNLARGQAWWLVVFAGCSQPRRERPVQFGVVAAAKVVDSDPARKAGDGVCRNVHRGRRRAFLNLDRQRCVLHCWRDKAFRSRRHHPGKEGCS